MIQNFKSLIKSQKAKILLGALGLYILSTGVSWAAFSFLGQGQAELVSPVSLTEKRSRIDLSAPKTEVCPLTGAKFTKAERDIWEKRRPLGIIVENHEEARPQSGLSRADIVYEAVAEGGITRLMVIYFCGASAEDVLVGPVRSARTYFIDWMSEYADFPLYAHVGGANRPGPADALGQLIRYGWVDQGNDLNQFSIGFPTFWRDYERIGHPVATEHTMYSTTDKLWEIAKERGLTEKDKKGARWDKNFVSWRFKEGEAKGIVSSVSFPFWSGYAGYSVRWEYDASTNSWNRFSGGNSHIDLNNNEQLKAANVVIVFTRERGLGDLEKHLLYTTTGSGRALIFKNGDVTSVTWTKEGRTDRTKFLDSEGREVTFVPGPIWIEVLPIGTQVSY